MRTPFQSPVNGNKNNFNSETCINKTRIADESIVSSLML